MTFGELLEMTRAQILVDEYEDAYEDEDVLMALWRASVEVAAAFDIPRVATIMPVEEGSQSIEPPERCAKVHSIVIDDDDLRSADLPIVLRMMRGKVRPSRYFNFDPARARTGGGDADLNGILIAPPSPGGQAVVVYTRELVRPTEIPALLGASPWEGALARFHTLIPYRAAIALYEMDERENETQHWMQEFQTRVQELAAFLGRTDVSSLMVAPEQRNDEGAEG